MTSTMLTLVGRRARLIAMLFAMAAVQFAFAAHAVEHDEEHEHDSETCEVCHLADRDDVAPPPDTIFVPGIEWRDETTAGSLPTNYARAFDGFVSRAPPQR